MFLQLVQNNVERRFKPLMDILAQDQVKNLVGKFLIPEAPAFEQKK